MAQTLLIDTTPGFRMPTLFLSQDDIGREFSIDLRSRFGDSLPASPTIKIEATKPSGFGFSVAADSISNSVATFTTIETMTNEAGRFLAELSIEKNSVLLFTAKFYIECVQRAHPDGTTDGDAQSVIPTLTVLVQRIEAAAASIHDLSVEATTLAYNADATATYNDELNKITFGIPRGGAMAVTDPDSDGNIVITFA